MNFDRTFLTFGSDYVSSFTYFFAFLSLALLVIRGAMQPMVKLAFDKIIKNFTALIRYLADCVWCRHFISLCFWY